MKYALLFLIAGTLVFHGVVAKAVEPMFEIGYYNIQYDEDMRNSTGEVLRLGLKDFPVYLWGQQESNTPTMSGQKFGDADLTMYGIGVKHEFGKVRVFGEFGRNDVSFTSAGRVAEEMTLTTFYQQHDYEGRYKPGQQWDSPDYVGPARGPFTTEYSYEIDDGWIGRLGLSWQVFEHFSMYGSYRWATVGETLGMWDVGPGVPPKSEHGGTCACWWKNNDTRDLSGAEFGVMLTW